MNSDTSENMFLIRKPKGENNDKITIRTSDEPHIYWKKHFYDNPLFLSVHQDFETDKENDNSSIRNKTTRLFNIKNGGELTQLY